jgi:hypothetical protein
MIWAYFRLWQGRSIKYIPVIKINAVLVTIWQEVLGFDLLYISHLDAMAIYEICQ